MLKGAFESHIRRSSSPTPQRSVFRRCSGVRWMPYLKGFFLSGQKMFCGEVPKLIPLISPLADGRKEGREEVVVEGLLYGLRTGGRTGGRADGRTGGRTDGRTARRAQSARLLRRHPIFKKLKAEKFSANVQLFSAFYSAFLFSFLIDY